MDALEQRKQQTIALSPIEQLMKTNWEQLRLPARTAAERKRQMAGVREEMKQLLADPDARIPEGMRREIQKALQNEDPETQTAVSGGRTHIRQEDYGLTDQHHVSVSYHVRYTPNVFHDHRCIELAYVMDGNVTQQIRFGDEVEEVHMHTGSVLIIPPGQVHNVEIFDESVMYNILVHADTFRDSFLSRLPDQNLIHDFFSRMLSEKHGGGYLLIHTVEQEPLDRVLFALLDEQEQQDPYADGVCDRLLGIWLLFLLRLQTETEAPKMLTREASNATVLSMLMYIDAHCETVSLAQLCEHYHYSPAWLNRVFRRETGTTVQSYILKTRMKKACDLLEHTAWPVARVAEQLGYEAVSYFVTCFRKEHGKTPLQWRKEHASISNI